MMGVCEEERIILPSAARFKGSFILVFHSFHKEIFSKDAETVQNSETSENRPFFPQSYHSVFNSGKPILLREKMPFPQYPHYYCRHYCY